MATDNDRGWPRNPPVFWARFFAVVALLIFGVDAMLWACEQVRSTTVGWNPSGVGVMSWLVVMLLLLILAMLVQISQQLPRGRV